MLRREKTLNVVRQQLLPLAKSVLAQSISQHYSQAAWEDVAQIITDKLIVILEGSCALEDALGEGDLHDVKGRVNKEGVLKALEELRDAQNTPGSLAKLKYLADHARTVIGKP